MRSQHDEPADAAGRGPALEVRGVRKAFAGVAVLRDVDLVVRPSSVCALAGHNGSGKSTLIKTLAGFYAPDRDVTGTSFGRSFALGDHTAASRVGLRFVHQDLGLVEDLSTVENLALGTGFPRRRSGTIRWGEARRRSRAAMAALGYDIDVSIPVGLLSAAERTGVAIARALEQWSGRPAVVVLDEPTAAMPSPEVDRLFDAIRRLRHEGLGIVYVTHHLDEILTIADDVTVLRNGEVVMSREASGLTHSDLVHAIVGRELELSMHTTQYAHTGSAGRTVLKIEDLRTTRIHGASLSVAAGEVVGFAGIAGSGRDDILPAIAGGIDRSGSVQIGEATVPPRRPRAAIRAGLGCVPADRQRAALLPGLTAATNLTVSGLQRYVRLGLLDHRAEIDDAREWFQQLEVSPSNPNAQVLTLSGGNQQKLILGRWLRRQPTILALDEPTQGVDVGACQAIYAALQRASEAGCAVLISSADSDELAALCHRVLVFARGCVVGELAGPQLTAAHIDAISLDANGREAMTI
jgi:ribose transport system ATP-binding protein